MRSTPRFSATPTAAWTTCSRRTRPRSSGTAEFPDGRAPDHAAFATGLDFTDPRMSPAELRAVQDWYQITLGEIPPHVKFLAAHRPDLLKAYRQRFETCVRELPKQIVPTTLLHYNVIRGFASASLTGIETLDLIQTAAADIFATWDTTRP